MRLSALKKRLGDILLEAGIITSAQLKEALDIQKRNGGKLGTILAQMGIINEEVMLAFLGKQCGVSYVSLAEYGEIPHEVVSALPESLVRHQKLIPIAREGNVLTVAMSDPFNIFAVDDVKLRSGYDMKIVIAAETEIKAAIEKYYFHKSGIEDILLSLSSLIEAPGAPSSPGSNDEALLKSFFSQAIGTGVSDIFFEPVADSVRIRYRINGLLQEQSRLSKEFMKVIIHQFKRIAGLDPARNDVPATGIVHTTDGAQDMNIRISLCPTVHGEKMILQIQDARTLCLNMNDLGFDPEVLSIYRKHLEAPGRLILVTGPLQSGKTTTLYSTIASLNFPDRDIVAIERSPEHFISGITQSRTDPAAGSSYASLLEFHLQHHPDAVMIDDIPDRETARAVFGAALSGHLVFSAISAGSMHELFHRLAALGIAPPLIASALSLVVHQRLVRKVCPDCRESYEIPASDLKSIDGLPGAAAQADSRRITLWRGKGCVRCHYTGYRGRTGIFRLFRIDDETRQLLLSGGISAIAEKIPFRGNSSFLREAAWRKVQSGVTTIEEIMWP